MIIFRISRIVGTDAYSTMGRGVTAITAAAAAAVLGLGVVIATGVSSSELYANSSETLPAAANSGSNDGTAPADADICVDCFWILSAIFFAIRSFIVSPPDALFIEEEIIS